jgi:GxxExxY protein
MNANEREWLDDLVKGVVGAAYGVSNTLGAGFLEKVYERALMKELGLRGLRALSQVPIPVQYKGETVGDYFADILDEGQLIVELKCVSRITGENVAQCINYLKATGLKVCLLINFQHPRVEWKRIVHNF